MPVSVNLTLIFAQHSEIRLLTDASLIYENLGLMDR